MPLGKYLGFLARRGSALWWLRGCLAARLMASAYGWIAVPPQSGYRFVMIVLTTFGSYFGTKSHTYYTITVEILPF